MRHVATIKHHAPSIWKGTALDCRGKRPFDVFVLQQHSNIWNQWDFISSDLRQRLHDKYSKWSYANNRHMGAGPLFWRIDYDMYRHRLQWIALDYLLRRDNILLYVLSVHLGLFNESADNSCTIAKVPALSPKSLQSRRVLGSSTTYTKDS